tara:strand:- start:712 stop:1032 length:321 start_codon:yes stop_codon:yes gene_type:complete
MTAVRNGTGQDLIITQLGWVVNDANADFKLKIGTNIINAFQSAGFSLITVTDNYDSAGYGGTITLPAPILLGPNQELQVNAENFNTDKSTTSYLELTWSGYLVSDS